MIPVGTTLVFTVGVETTLLNGLPDIESAMNQELSNAGLPVSGGWKSSGSFAQMGVPYTPATLSGTIYTTGVFADLSSIQAIIDGAVQDVTGSAPTAATAIVSTALPGGSAQATGQPGAQAPQTPGIIASVEDFFSTLGSDTVTALVILVAVVIVVLLIAGYAPNVRHIAGAVA